LPQCLWFKFSLLFFFGMFLPVWNLHGSKE